MSHERARFSGRDTMEALASARQHFGVNRSELEYEVVERRDLGPLEESRATVEIEAWVVPGRVAPSSDRPERSERPARGAGRFGRGDRGDRDRGPDRDDRGSRRREAETVTLDPPQFMPPKTVVDPIAVLTQLGTALVSGLDLDLTIEKVTEDQSGFRIHLDGDDAYLLTDNDAVGLEALQYLANRVIHKDGRLDIKVSLDAGRWREQMEAHLVEHARQIAEEVLRTKQEQALEQPLSPYERRLVHVALAEMAGIKTYSSGTGYARRLHIAVAHD